MQFYGEEREGEMPVLVREGLYIGDIEDAAQVLSSGSDVITHVLSLLSSASMSFFSEWRSTFHADYREVEDVFEEDANGNGKLLFSKQMVGPELKITRMAVPLRDMERENLLDYLEPCLDFIDLARRSGDAVLVHCFAGVSRSASVVMAYLMKTERISQEDALESLRDKNEMICPNDGFLEQLKMFEEMDFKVNRESSIYKKFKLKLLGEAYSRGEKIINSKFAADPNQNASTPIDDLEKKSAVSETSENEKSMIVYRCKKCRRIVASQGNVLSHLPGEGEAAFMYTSRSVSWPIRESKEPECSCIFIEPLKWMTTVEEGVTQGKLACMGCQARLGHFNWSGIRCNCGAWVTPAFQLHKGRVDASAT